MTKPQIDGLIAYLELPVTEMRDVGTRRAKDLAHHGITTIWDLLYYRPLRYHMFADPVPIRGVPLDHPVLCAATITEGYSEQWGSARSRRRRYFSATASDDTGVLTINWFHDLKGMGDRLQPGTELYLYGPVKIMRRHKTMVHPRIWMKGAREYPDVEPVYRGFGKAAGFWFRKLVHSALESLPQNVDIWPPEIKERFGLINMYEACRRTHTPAPEDLDPVTLRNHEAERRLRFDSLFTFLFALQRERERSRSRHSYPFDPPDSGYQGALQKLPWKPTRAQESALQTCIVRRGQGERINAILHGDVGSGKTMVAGMLAAHTAENKLQTAVVAPTEILARQHFAFFERLFRGTPIHVALLTGSTPAKQKEQIYRNCKTGKIPILIGTHAIFEEKLKFARLGLTVVDEQHRFGVAQREALRLKDPSSDLLVMSATPIPRSLLMSLYGDLEPIPLSTAPAGRKQIETRWLKQKERGTAMEQIKKELAADNRIYFVYPLIDESDQDEESDLKGVETSYKNISTYFGNEKVAMLHGRMKEKAKNEVFEKFRDGLISILVSTTVIEVGVDVPEATVMVIQNADRFGLAQLHQLRGRVGRGGNQGYCFLISDAEPDSTAAERLQAMQETNDGFVLAEKDLELRGAGEILGDRQSGSGSFGQVSLVRDRALLDSCMTLAHELAESNSDLEGVEWEGVRAWVRRFYSKENALEGG